MGLSLFGFLLPVILLVQLLVSSVPRDVLKNLAGEGMAEALISFMVCIVWFILCSVLKHKESFVKKKKSYFLFIQSADGL